MPDFQSYWPWALAAVTAFAGVWVLLMNYFKRLFCEKQKTVSTVLTAVVSFLATVAVVSTSVMMVFSIYTVIEIVIAMS